MAMTQREKAALDQHITSERPWQWADEAHARGEAVYITKTVACVVPDSDAELTTYEAAFLAIARDDAEGRYEFTIGTQRFIVTTERPDPQQTDPHTP